nr:hypothetical protein [Tanacetum cinerariifolium]
LKGSGLAGVSGGGVMGVVGSGEMAEKMGEVELQVMAGKTGEVTVFSNRGHGPNAYNFQMLAVLAPLVDV